MRERERLLNVSGSCSESSWVVFRCCLCLAVLSSAEQTMSPYLSRNNKTANKFYPDFVILYFFKFKSFYTKWLKLQSLQGRLIAFYILQHFKGTLAYTPYLVIWLLQYAPCLSHASEKRIEALWVSGLCEHNKLMDFPKICLSQLDNIDVLYKIPLLNTRICPFEVY